MTSLTLAELAMTAPVALVLLILGFGFVIFVHELGHFLVAKAVGIRVSQFAIGFGHALLCYRKGMGVRVGTTEGEFNRRVSDYLQMQGVRPHPHQELELTEEVVNRARPEPAIYTSEQTGRAAAALGLGETEYRLNWLPLGGYVKMLGQEDLDPTAASDDPRSYSRKPVWARLAVVSAGVVMNAIFAVIFFIVAFMYGVEFPPALVGQVFPGSPAATAPAEGRPDVVGLREGDVILSIDGKQPDDFFDLAVASALARRDERVTLTVQRPDGLGVEGGTFTFRVTPRSLPGQALQTIGVMPPAVPRVITFDEATPEERSTWDSLYGRRGFRPGIKLTHVDGEPVEDVYVVDRAVQQSQGQDVQFTFADDQGQVTVTAAPRTLLRLAPLGDQDGASDKPHLMGLVPPIKVVGIAPPRKFLWFESKFPADGVLAEGDIILKIGSFSLPTATQAVDAVKAAKEGPLEITVFRDGAEQTFSITPADGKLGVRFDYAADTNLVASVLPDSPFAPLNLIAPARIESIQGQETRSYSDIRRALLSSTGPVEVKYVLPLPGQERQVESEMIELSSVQRSELASLRWAVDLPPFDQLKVVQKAPDVASAARMGFKKSWVFMVQTYQTLRALFARTVPADELRGPIGIAHAGTQLTRRGWTYLMFFLGVISVNLAVLNFLPVPILDGGLAVMLILEKIRGRPVSPQIQNAISLVGLALILTIFLYVTAHDILRLITST